MARKSSSEAPLSLLERATIVMLGVYLAAVATGMMIGGHYVYRNYLHTQVVAPLGLVIGIVLIAAGLAMRR